MIVQRQADEIVDWRLAFFPIGKYRWARFVPGRFKHVAAYGYSRPCRTWVLYDVTLAGTRVFVLPDGGDSLETIAAWLAGASVLSMTALQHDSTTATGRLGFWCVPAMKHLTGVRCGAMTPTGLYRYLIERGAEVIIDGQQHGTTGSTSRR